MKSIVTLSLVSSLAAVTACKPPTESANAPPAVDVAALEASLEADPKRLRQTLRRCQVEREIVGEVTCDTANRVQRQQFMGSGTTKYTPGGGPSSPRDE